MFEQVNQTILDPTLYFKLNDNIQLRYKDKYYQSRVEDLQSKFIWVSWPTVHGINIRFRKNEVLDLINPRKDEIYAYRVRIINGKTDPISLLQLEILETLGQIQRRDDCRVDFRVSARYRIIEPRIRKTLGYTSSNTLNISAGGTLILADRRSHPLIGDKLELLMVLPGVPILHMQARVIRLEPIPNTSIYCGMAVQFLDIKESTRQIILKQIFDRQLSLRKSGLL